MSSDWLAETYCEQRLSRRGPLRSSVALISRLYLRRSFAGLVESSVGTKDTPAKERNGRQIGSESMALLGLNGGQVPNYLLGLARSRHRTLAGFGTKLAHVGVVIPLVSPLNTSWL